MVTQSSQADSESSFYLAYIVALHVATALALLWFFRADWVRIIRGFLRSLPASVRWSLQARRLRLSVLDKDERLAWMIVFATIPVGEVGVWAESTGSARVGGAWALFPQWRAWREGRSLILAMVAPRTGRSSSLVRSGPLLHGDRPVECLRDGVVSHG